MKAPIVILILSLFLFSCNSPERKIKNSFKFQRGKFKIEDVRIYDTIYLKNVDENMEFIYERTKYLKKSVKMANEYRDSILQLQYPKPKQDSLLGTGYQWRRHRQRELDHLFFRQAFTESLYSETNDTIAGYRARIITRYDTLEFIVSPLTFQIVCPVFMYEK